MNLFRRFGNANGGQNVVEYALVLLLVALAALVGLTATGTSVTGWWNAIDGFVAGFLARI